MTNQKTPEQGDNDPGKRELTVEDHALATAAKLGMTPDQQLGVLNRLREVKVKNEIASIVAARFETSFNRPDQLAAGHPRLHCLLDFRYGVAEEILSRYPSVTQQLPVFPELHGGATEEQIEAAHAAASAIRDAHRARDIELFGKGQDGREAGTICAQCGWQLVPMYAWQAADGDGHDAAVEREAMRAALESAHPAGERHDAEEREAEPPVYLALDVWQALGLPVGEFDSYYERNGWADTWANLMYAPGGVSRRPICGVAVGGEACVLREHGNGPHMGAGDVGSTEALPQAESEDHAATVTGKAAISTENVRQTFAYVQAGLDDDDGYPFVTHIHVEEFDRWLAGVQREAAGKSPVEVDEAKLAEVIESSAAEWGDSARVQSVLAQYIARSVTEWLRGEEQ